MSPNQAALLALVIAVIVGFLVYSYGKCSGMASVVIAAIVGLILQSVFLMFVLPDHPIVAAVAAAGKGQDVAQAFVFPGWMSLIYLVVLIVIAFVYAYRDRRIVVA